MKQQATTAGAGTRGPIKWMPVVAWTMTFIWMGVIFWFSAQPFSANVTEQYLGGFNVPIRKLAHMTEFGILFCLWRWSISCTFGNARHTPLLALAATIVYAASDEYHQSFVPGRSATLSDALVDSMGALCAWALWNLIHGIIRRSRCQ